MILSPDGFTKNEMRVIKSYSQKIEKSVYQNKGYCEGVELERLAEELRTQLVLMNDRGSDIAGERKTWGYKSVICHECKCHDACHNGYLSGGRTELDGIKTKRLKLLKEYKLRDLIEAME